MAWAKDYVEFEWPDPLPAGQAANSPWGKQNHLTQSIFTFRPANKIKRRTNRLAWPDYSFAEVYCTNQILS
jgi:hypothetical protein